MYYYRCSFSGKGWPFVMFFFPLTSCTLHLIWKWIHCLSNFHSKSHLTFDQQNNHTLTVYSRKGSLITRFCGVSLVTKVVFIIWKLGFNLAMVRISFSHEVFVSKKSRTQLKMQVGKSALDSFEWNCVRSYVLKLC